jgi:uncharacterized metal-binding protein YceD (DUF177 family)
MTTHPGPLSRPLVVDQLPARGLDTVVEATPVERDALARDFGLAAIHALAGSFQVKGDVRRLKVSGRVKASVVQTCVVTLEPFDVEVNEEVDVDFTEAVDKGPSLDEVEITDDMPDEIVNGRIDLGALTAEFLALGLDRYPKKPGAAFETSAGEGGDDSPFAKLKELKRDG